MRKKIVVGMKIRTEDMNYLWHGTVLGLKNGCVFVEWDNEDRNWVDEEDLTYPDGSHIEEVEE